MKHFLAIAATLVGVSSVTAQAQVGVGTTSPDSKSALDIRSTDKGLLIPRLTPTQRMGITAPPQGLMVYQTDGSTTGGPQTGFWYYAGSGGWVYLDAASSSGLTLPYSGTASTSSPAFAVSNTGNGQALSGSVGGNGTAAVRGENTSPTSGSGTGVLGVTVSGHGVRGTASGTNGYGVTGEATDSRGVSGTSASGTGVYGTTSNNALTNAAIVGANTNTGSAATGVLGTSPTGYGVRGESTGSGGNGVQGQATDGHGLDGIATTGAAVVGSATSGTGVVGNSTSGIGVSGSTSNGSSSSGAVVGTNNSTGSGAVGVLGLTVSGYGVRGVASANGGWGVTGVATDSYGVIGQSSTGVGVSGTTAAGSGGGIAGVVGSSSNAGGIGVLGTTTGGSGVRGTASGSGGYGLEGTASATGGVGVAGIATGAATALAALTTGTGRAAFFSQANSSSSSPAVVISQSGPGLALDVTGGPVRTVELNSPSTSGANLLPVAYGRVTRTGTILSGTGNFTVVQNLPNYGVYTIAISNLSTTDLTNAICQVTCRFGVPGHPNAEFTATANGLTNGRVEIHVSALSTPFDLAEADFTFMVYQP